jgi:hypothetical protein
MDLLGIGIGLPKVGVVLLVAVIVFGLVCAEAIEERLEHVFKGMRRRPCA